MGTSSKIRQSQYSTLNHSMVRKGDSSATFKAAMEQQFPDEKPSIMVATEMQIVMASGVDILASGALLETQRIGIKVSQRLAIAGFGDFELSRHLLPPLTTVAVPSAEIERQAGELLLEAMRGETSTNTIVDFGFELKIRASG